MPQIVKSDETLGPLHVAVLGASGIVPHANRMANLVQEPRRPRQWQVSQVQMQELLVKKGQRLIGLIETAQRILLALADMLEKPLNVALSQLARVTFPVK
jgi:hypothetical protein